MKVILLVGLPGSGKSTWARAQGYQVLSSDEMRLKLSGDETNQTIHGKVFGAMRYLLRLRLQLGQEVTVIDATNLRRRDRKPFLKIAQQYGAEAEAVWFDVPVEVAEARNRKRARVVPEGVIAMLAQRLQAPTEAEGFARIVRVGEGDLHG
jgi:predicted kinase